MTNGNNPTTAALGSIVGKALKAQKAAGGKEKILARDLVDAILKECPNAKLPWILENEQVREWQQSNSVSKSHIKTCLTEARKEQAAVAEKKAKRREQQAPKSNHDSSPTPKAENGLVPNRNMKLI